MGHTKGLRSRTRHLFAKPFRRHGHIHLSKQMETYRVGDTVNIVTDSAVQKGMPAKYYNGKTGRVFNVTARGVGVIVNKQVGHRIIHKRINVRTAHVRKSRAVEKLKQRVKENEKKKAEARKAGTFVQVKRQPAQPRGAIVVEGEYETLNPLRHRYIF